MGESSTRMLCPVLRLYKKTITFDPKSHTIAREVMAQRTIRVETLKKAKGTLKIFEKSFLGSNPPPAIIAETRSVELLGASEIV